jgi:DNA helicase IV
MKRPSLFDVELVPEQRSAVDLSAERNVLVLGEAGHGKTTVALHRLARLWKDSRRAAVIVPTEGLVRLIQPLMKKLGIDVEAMTYERFASKQARRAFRRLPRESESAPANVLRVKRARELLDPIATIARRGPSRIDDDPEAKPTPRADLQQLFGDRALLEPLFPPNDVAAVLDRTRRQFDRATKDEFADVDRARLEAIDRLSLDEGTVTHSIDVEDYAVLFAIDRLRTNKARVQQYDVIAVDEAQELAPLELALVGRSLAVGGVLVVSGDADQQTDPTASFADWDRTMRDLGCAAWDSVTLEMGHRCPRDVVALARSIRAGNEAPTPIAFDPAAIAKDWEDVREDDPLASLVVLCHSPKTAVAVHKSLPSRLVLDGRFLPRGPVQVSTVDEVKGLEFDYVVVADTPKHDRKSLYVAITRARHQVVLAK